MSHYLYHYTRFQRSNFIKRIKSWIVAGFFLGGNVISTLPVMARPIPSSNIVVDTNAPVNQRPTLDVTHNGIDQVNIVHPNDRGVSHNKFNQYNVNEAGQILNNSPTITNTKLAGQITGNPHLRDGKTANLILNEVTGHSPTKLLGYTEIAGKQAALVIANPSGITCSGCGFINTTRTSLATGRPQLDKEGNLQSITVNGGEIGFEGKGGNFAEVPVLDIISRKVRIDAPVTGQALRVTAGRNQYHYADGTATALASDGSQSPEFAIDTSVLGGMTGNHIQMLVNEKGAGVRVDGHMASTAGDMQLTADGKLVIHGDMNAQNNVNAHVDVVENTGTIGAQNAVNLQASSVNNTGSITAKGNQTSQIIAYDRIDNAGSITASNGSLALQTQELQNHAKSTLASQHDLSIESNHLSNQGNLVANEGNLTARVNGTLSNTDQAIIATNNGNITLYSGLGIDNSNSTIIAQKTGTINLTTQGIIHNNQGEVLTPLGSITMTTDRDFNNNLGKVQSGSGDIAIQSKNLVNSSGLIMNGVDHQPGNISLVTGNVENSKGVIQSGSGTLYAAIGHYNDSDAGLFYAGNRLDITASDMKVAGNLQSKQDLVLHANSLDLMNKDATLSSLNGNGQLVVTNSLINNGGILFPNGRLNFSAGSFANKGQLTSGVGGLNFKVQGDFLNTDGSLTTDASDINLSISGMLDNSNGQIGIKENGNVTLQTGSILNNNGLIRTGKGDVFLTTTSLDNRQGSILTSTGNIHIDATRQLVNTKGQIGPQDTGDITLTTQGILENTQGSMVTSKGNIQLAADQLVNTGGQIGNIHNGNLQITTQNSILNSTGKIISKAGDLDIQGGLLDNSQGLILTNAGHVNLNANQQLINMNGQIGSQGQGDLTLMTRGDLNNNQGSITTSAGDIHVTANNLYNQGQAGDATHGQIGNLETGDIKLEITHIIQNNKGKIITKAGDLTIIGGSLDNRYGAIVTNTGNVDIQADQQILNNNGQIGTPGEGSITLVTKGDLNNELGSITTQAKEINLQIGGDLDNTQGNIIISTGDLDFTTHSLSNNQGQIGIKENGNVTLQSGDIVNQNGLIRTGNGNIVFKASALDNTQGSILTHTGYVNIDTDQQLLNIKGQIGLQEQGNITLTTHGDFKNDQGNIITSSGDLHSTANNFSNHQGQFGSQKGNLVVTVQKALSNTGGKIVTENGTMQLASGSLDNSQGFILTNSDDIVIHADQQLININGQIGPQTKGNITLVTRGALNNDHGNIMTPLGMVDLTADIIANDSGQIGSKNGNIHLTAQGNILNNTGKIITETGDAYIQAGGLDNSQGYVMAEQGNVDIQGGSLINRSGNILAGNLSHPGNMTLKVTDIDNTQGILETLLGSMNLTSGNYQDSQGGLIYAGQTVTMDASGQVNSGGDIQGKTGLTLTANRLNLATAKASLSSLNGAMNLTLAQDLVNQGDIFVTQGGLSIQAGSVINQGQITTHTGALTANIEGNLTNQGGSILSNQNPLTLQVTGQLDNSGGQIGIVNDGPVKLIAGDLLNKNGLIRTNNGLIDLHVANLDNSQGSILNKRGNLDLNISKDLINNKGQIGAQQLGDVTISAQGNVQNIQGQISTPTGTVHITGQDINNSNGSMGSDHGDIVLQIANLINHSGIIFAGTKTNDGDIHLTTADIDNTQGIIQSASGFVDASFATYTDRGAGLFYAGRSMTLKATGDINVAGVLQSYENLSINANTFNATSQAASLNSLSQDVNLDLKGGLSNQGQIFANKGSLIVTANSLTNSGTLYGLDHVALTVQNKLSNQGVMPVSGDQLTGGTIQSGYDLILMAASLDNSGLIDSHQDTSVTLTGSLSNQQTIDYTPTLHAGRNLTLATSSLENKNGHILSEGLLTLTSQHQISNMNGYLQSGQAMTLQTSQIVNKGHILALGGDLLMGQGTNQAIPALTLIDNSDGTIQGSGKVEIDAASYQSSSSSKLNADGQFKGHFSDEVQNNGQMVAQGDLVLNSASLVNGGSGLIDSQTGSVTLTTSAANGMNNAGYIQVLSANRQLTINTSQLTNSGTLYTTGQGIFNLAHALYNTRQDNVVGKILVNQGDLVLNIPIIENQGVITSTNNLAMNAQTIINNGYINADHYLSLQAADNIINQSTSAIPFSNNITLQSGALLGDTITLTAPALTNKGGWIQAHGDIITSSQTLTNIQQGTMLSTHGNLTLQGWESSQNNVQPINRVNNEGGTLQASNQLNIATTSLMNHHGVLTSQNGDIKLDQGSSGAALVNFVNDDGTVQAARDLAFNFTSLTSTQNSKILAGGNLQLTLGNDFTNNGLLWGGKNIALTLPSLINKGTISTDQGLITLIANHGGVINDGKIQSLGSNQDAIIIHAASLDNAGSILANSTINLNMDGLINNQTTGEITAYNQGNLELSGNAINNGHLMLAGGTLTGNVSGTINNTGYIYGAQGLTLNSNTQLLNSNSGQIGIDHGTLSFNMPVFVNKGGQIIAKNGNITFNATNAITNNGWLQSMGDMQLLTPMLNNSSGVILSANGKLTIERDLNGNGLDQLDNNKGILQSASDMTVYSDQLDNQSGTVLTTPSLGNGTTGKVTIYRDQQGHALGNLNLADKGILQASANLWLAAQSSGLSSTGTILANQNLNAVIEGDLINNNILFSSLGNQNTGVTLTINGNYLVGEEGGVTSNGYLKVQAGQLTNNGVLTSAGDMQFTTNNLTNNSKGLLSSHQNMQLIVNGKLDNFGVIQTDQGSMTMQVTGDIINKGGLIRTQSANGDIYITANSFTNDYTGTLVTEAVNEKTVYDKAINDDGQEFAGLTNKEVVEADNVNDDINVWGNKNLNKYFYASNVKMLQIHTPKGMYKADGTPATGYFYFFLSGGRWNPNARVEVTGTGTRTKLNGTSAIITAGRDLSITATGAITNDVSHIEAGRNMQLTASALNNKGYQDSVVYKLGCYNNNLCRGMYPRDPAKAANPPYGHPGPMDGNSINHPKLYVWGSNTVNRGLSGTIVAGGALIGKFAGSMNNDTIIQHADHSHFTQANPDLPAGQSPPSATKGQTAQDGLNGVGKGSLTSDNTNGTASLNGQDTTLPGYGGIITPEGKDPGLHVTLPGFNETGSSTVHDILASITGGEALFRPNPSIDSHYHGATVTGIGNHGLAAGNTVNIAGSGNVDTTIAGHHSADITTIPGHTITDGNNGSNGANDIDHTAHASFDGSYTTPDIHASVNQGSVHSSPVPPHTNYLIETRPQYTSINEFYGSQYLLDRLKINGSYLFLGDKGFDTNYIQQQYIRATGQSFTGGTYTNASDSMKALLDHATDEASKLGLQFGVALTPDQQSALNEDIVWYIPQMVDGQKVLVPQLYLSSKTDRLAGGAIKGKDVDITAGSIHNSGLLQGSNSIALTAKDGNINNQGGTIKGGQIFLNAQNGSVINADTVNHYLTEGGSSSQLASQGQIIASGNLGIKASDSITTHGGLIQSGGDLAMQAGTITIGTTELKGSGAGVQYKSHSSLSYAGQDTKNYGTTIKASGNAALQSTKGDLTFAGSNLTTGKDVALSSAGNVNLNSVTDSSAMDIKGYKSGAFNSSSFENKNAYTNQLGSNLISGGALSIDAKKDISLTGNLASHDDLTMNASGSIKENAMKNTSDEYDYHKTKKFGFFGDEAALSGSVGEKKNMDQHHNISTTWTASNIQSSKGSVNMTAGKDVTITGSNIAAGQNVSITGSSVNFNTVKNITHKETKHKDSFTGLTASVDSQSTVGGIAKNSLAASNAKNSTDQLTGVVSASSIAGTNVAGKLGLLDQEKKNTYTAAKNQAIDKANKDKRAGIDYNLIGASASIGHQLNKSHSTSTVTTDVGSNVSAGGKLSITATGKNKDDANRGNINATSSHFNANDIEFNAPGQINLNAGYQTTESKAHSSSSSFGVGASVDVGMEGGSASITGNMSLADKNSHSSSKTAMDTVVNGKNSVTINNGSGHLTLNGAEITNKNDDGSASNGKIAINTGSMTITSPQNTSKYDSENRSIGIGVSIPVAGFGWDSPVNAPDTPFTQNTNSGGIKLLHNDYASTEKTLSGIYAGKGGLTIDVTGKTKLTGGVISSEAEASKNHMNTGSLEANSIQNHSKWSGMNIGGSETNKSQYTLNGTATDAKNNNLLPGNVLNATQGPNFKGNVTSHDGHSTTNSAIGGNITVNAGSTTGLVANDVQGANGYLVDNFDPKKIDSDFNKQNSINQSLNTITNDIVDVLYPDLSGFKEPDPKKNPDGKKGYEAPANIFGMTDRDTAQMISSGVSSIGGAIFGNGDVGATVGGVVGGDLVNTLLPDASKDVANALAPEKQNPLQHQNAGVTGGQGGRTGGQGGKLQSNVNKDEVGNSVQKNPTYDTTTDIHKLLGSIAHGVIVGGAGAIGGIITGNGNINVDVTAGGLTGLQQHAPKIIKPKNQKIDPKKVGQTSNAKP